jgi:hypothetical protein
MLLAVGLPLWTQSLQHNASMARRPTLSLRAHAFVRAHACVRARVCERVSERVRGCVRG